MDLEARKNMIDSNSTNLSIAKQCDLLILNKSTYYYKQRGLTARDLEIMKVIDEIYTERPYNFLLVIRRLNGSFVFSSNNSFSKGK